MTSKESDMFFKIIKDIEESDEQQVYYDEEFQLSKYAYVINNAETFKEMGYQVINKESVFGFDTVYLKRNKKVDNLPSATPSYNSIKTELKPCEDCIRELIREFDNKHPALFTDYMREFNNHPISEIIDYMWDMHDLIEDIKYRLPDEGGDEE